MTCEAPVVTTNVDEDSTTSLGESYWASSSEIEKYALKTELHRQIASKNQKSPRRSIYEADLQPLFRVSLERIGFDSSAMQTELHVVPWVLNDPDELFRAKLSGSVRSGDQLRQESKSSLENIRRAMRIKIEESYNENHNWVLPMAAYVVTAIRKGSYL